VAKEATLPRLGQGMESGIVVKWLKAEGDRVEKGEPLYEVETDKATQEVEAEASGVLLKILVQSGEVPVGQVVAVIGEAGETVEAAAPAAEAPEAEAPAAEAPAAEAPAAEAVVEEPKIEENEPVTAPVSTESAVNGDGDRVKASPLARRIARERGIDLASLIGTGPDGRIVAEDVERPAKAAPAPVAAAAAAPEPKAEAPAAPVVSSGDVESVPLSTIRKTIARRLTAAWEVPVFVLTVSVDMTPANSLIERARELNPDVRITVTDLLAKVCAQALMRHADVNVQFTDGAILRFPSAHIGIAAAAPQGLVVPVIRSVERLSLSETAQHRAEVIGRARDNKLQQSDLEGGTFTISNLGMFGVEQFVAILNPPQAAILAVGATEERAVVVNGEIVARPMMTISLTVDHRAVDGAPAADFLRTVKTFLEEPALAL
jgi:pyruvate dehydrogenase E2 component (dihydrolipoamide acetyltransferase)